VANFASACKYLC